MLRDHKHPQRNSSVELLRLLLMFLIVVHHGIVHGLGLTSLSPKFNSVLLLDPTDSPIILLVNSLCIVGVNCFILISGYYKIKLTKGKVLNLISILIFYSLLFNVIPELVQHNFRGAIKSLFFFSHSPYWFVIDYIFLMFFAPLFNLMFEKMDRKYITTLLVVMTIISVYFGFIWNNKVNDSGYTFFQFIYIYCLGRYLYGIKIGSSKAILIYIVCSTLTTIAMYLLINIGYPELAWRMTYYNNPLIILSAIGLFFLFKNWIFHSKKINYIAKSALAIYLVQSSLYISKIYYGIIGVLWNNGVYTMPGGNILLYISILALAIVIGSLGLDVIRRIIFQTIDGFRHAKP